MKKASLVLLLLIWSSFTAITVLPEVARATTLYVGGAGSGNYTNIQDAVYDANPGDTVYAYRGTYFEQVDINKTLSLVGEGKDITVIDGGGIGDVVTVSADWVNITKFTVKNSRKSLELPLSSAGIRLDMTANCRITYSNVSDNDLGVLVKYSSGVMIEDNIVASNHKDGIYVYRSDNNIIARNYVSNNLGDGILLYDSNENSIVNNTVSSNPNGIEILHSDHNILAGNIVSMNWGCGACVYESNRNDIWSNDVSDNRDGIEVSFSDWNTITTNNVSWNSEVGIELESSNDNAVINNTVSNNAQMGIWVWDSSNNSIHHNNFIDNEGQAVDYPYDVNHWDDGYPSGGNYWSDYGGNDRKSGSQQDSPGSDGIGDTLYDIKTGFVSCCPVREETGSKDIYPLMSPFVQPPLNDPNQPPTCIIETPLAEADISGIQTIGGSAYDSGGIMERVEIRVDDGEWIRAIGTTTWSFDWDTETVPNGDHVIYARSYDGMDYSEETSVVVTVDNLIVYEEVWFWAALVLGLVILVTVVVVLMRKK